MDERERNVINERGSVLVKKKAYIINKPIFKTNLLM